MISSAVPSLRKVRRAVSSEQKKMSTYGRIVSMQALASSPDQRLPRKLTSNEIIAPAALNRLIISIAVARDSGQRASVMPEVWKHLADSKIESSKSSMLIFWKEL